MINLGELITDPDFMQSFSVYRTTGSFVKGAWVAAEPKEFEMKGVITPASPKEINQLPEGDRISGAISVYTRDRVYSTDSSATVSRRTGQGVISDKIIWKGEYYKVYALSDYSDYGFYNVVAARTKGD
jgi:hypothetical protein